jgi:hypothetical protein
MPNKYEREIEEILRNMDQTDQGQSLGDRIRAFNRPAARARPARPRLRVRLTGSGALLIAGIFLALVAAALVFYFGRASTGLYANLAGIVGLVALGCILLGLFAGWSARFSNQITPTWRGQSESTAGGFAPFRAIATRWRIMRLKWRYWRNREH